MKHYVIIGNGVAAASCIEGIRKEDGEGRITVVSAEKYDVYCRPLISYYLEGKTDLTRIRYRSPDFYSRMDAEVLYGKRAVHIDPEKKQITLDDGSILPYDAACIAAGSSPFVPPFEGLNTVPCSCAFMTLDDVLALEAAIDKTSRVLIVGAGLIGLKCAEGILERVAQVTVCDLADRVLSSILDETCAGLMQKHLEQHGITFLLGDSVTQFDGCHAYMKSGKSVDFDVLVLAVGVRANTALVNEIGGDVNRGILVNQYMETSIPDVYAAGDCTEGYDASIGKNRVLAILPNATMQGYTAGVNMAACNAQKKMTHEKGIPMNSIGFFGLHAMTAGFYEGEMYEEKTEHSLKRLFTKDDQLKGFILIGCNERAGILTSMIREKTPVSSVNFELMKNGATTTAFSSDIRRKKFGGMV